MDAFTLQCQSLIIATKILWPTKTKRFIIWPFTEKKLANPWSKRLEYVCAHIYIANLPKDSVLSSLEVFRQRFRVLWPGWVSCGLFWRLRVEHRGLERSVQCLEIRSQYWSSVCFQLWREVLGTWEVSSSLWFGFWVKGKLLQPLHPGWQLTFSGLTNTQMYAVGKHSLCFQGSTMTPAKYHGIWLR